MLSSTPSRRRRSRPRRTQLAKLGVAHRCRPGVEIPRRRRRARAQEACRDVASPSRRGRSKSPIANAFDPEASSRGLTVRAMARSEVLRPFDSMLHGRDERPRILPSCSEAPRT
jgi:hypothetical protein